METKDVEALHILEQKILEISDLLEVEGTKVHLNFTAGHPIARALFKYLDQPHLVDALRRTFCRQYNLEAYHVCFGYGEKRGELAVYFSVPRRCFP